MFEYVYVHGNIVIGSVLLSCSGVVGLLFIVVSLILCVMMISVTHVQESVIRIYTISSWGIHQGNVISSLA